MSARYACSICGSVEGVPWNGVSPAICWNCREAGHKHPVLTKDRNPLPPTRSDDVCGKNRYATVANAFSALWAHAQAKGLSEHTMAVVSHEKCPGKFHIVAASKVRYYSEVHHG